MQLGDPSCVPSNPPFLCSLLVFDASVSTTYMYSMGSHHPAFPLHDEFYIVCCHYPAVLSYKSPLLPLFLAKPFVTKGVWAPQSCGAL